MTQFFAQLSFAYPAALWALLALPVIWWLLRTTPPRPREVRFPPFRLLEELRNRRRQPARTPWWLLLLRLALATALIIGLAGPRLVPPQSFAPAGKGAWLIVADNGWAAARNWPALRQVLLNTLNEAQRRNAPVAVLFTAPSLVAAETAPRPPADWLKQARAMQPVALDVDRAKVAALLKKLAFQPAQVVWLSDGVNAPGTDAFIAALKELRAPVRVHAPEEKHLPLALLAPKSRNDGLDVRALRPVAGGALAVPVVLRARNGRPLAEADIAFDAGKKQGVARLKVPPLLRNEAARLSIAGQAHAGAVWLLGDAFKRRTVLIISGETGQRRQPLLSATYYVSRALAPFAEVTEETDVRAIGRWLKAGLSMLVLADVGRLPAEQEQLLRRWVARGGVLLRFAGERIANAGKALLPVTLRRQERALGATLSWQQPQPLGGFADDSPLAGLPVDKEVRVRRQVLAEPDVELPQRTWATLADGTPLITARRSGRGWLVLVHVTAGPDWSNLPLSGLFVRILKRVSDLAPLARPMPDLTRPGALPEERQALPQPRESAARQTAGAFTPRQMLTGSGELAPMPAHALPLPAAAFEKARPSPRHPAGLYARGQQIKALNVGHDELTLSPLPALPASFVRAGYGAPGVRDLTAPFVLSAAGLFVLDLLAMLWLATGGRPARALRGASGAALLVVLALALSIVPVMQVSAREDNNDGKSQQRELAFAMEAARQFRLVFVKTGDARLDALVLAGLKGLSEQLFERTSVEPAEPWGIDIERDEIAFFPLIYWPVTENAKAPSARALRKLDRFLKNGGTILFDTRDAPDAAFAPDGMTPQRRALRRILEKLDIPPLEPVPRTHVLTRSFFLLKSFPGRFTGARMWVEARSIGRERERLSPANADGVSAVLITGNDLAGAWAVSPSGQPLLPVVPGGARQREYAYRTGINIVMYALTGNYKADQVHLPTILQRLGQ